MEGGEAPELKGACARFYILTEYPSVSKTLSVILVYSLQTQKGGEGPGLILQSVSTFI